MLIRNLALCFIATGIVHISCSTARENGDCMECHNDESLTKESTDNVLQIEITESLYVDEDKFNHSVHNINGVACVDCHTDIEELNWDKDVPHTAELQPVDCVQCHEESGEEFKDSVHMAIRSKGITMRCYACHGYHSVKQMASATVSERDNGICLKCHNPYQAHDWLPSAESHFAYVECVVCHAPNAPCHIDLKFFDLVTNTFYEADSLLKKIGMTSEQFMSIVDSDKGGIISKSEFDDLVLMLKLKDIRTILHAELVADIDATAHNINSGEAQRNCEKCHASDSSYFKAVYMVLTSKDGTARHYMVDRSVLESYYVSHFYLLGGTRIKLLDKIGMVIVACGGCVVIAHLTIRVLTIPLRRRKDEGLERSGDTQ